MSASSRQHAVRRWAHSRHVHRGASGWRSAYRAMKMPAKSVDTILRQLRHLGHHEREVREAPEERGLARWVSPSSWCAIRSRTRAPTARRSPADEDRDGRDRREREEHARQVHLRVEVVEVEVEDRSEEDDRDGVVEDRLAEDELRSSGSALRDEKVARVTGPDGGDERGEGARLDRREAEDEPRLAERPDQQPEQRQSR